jgi:hypothetical protein
MRDVHDRNHDQNDAEGGSKPLPSCEYVSDQRHPVELDRKTNHLKKGFKENEYLQQLATQPPSRAS